MTWRGEKDWSCVRERAVEVELLEGLPFCSVHDNPVGGRGRAFSSLTGRRVHGASCWRMEMVGGEGLSEGRVEAESCGSVTRLVHLQRFSLRNHCTRLKRRKCEQLGSKIAKSRARVVDLTAAMPSSAPLLLHSRFRKVPS